MLSIPEQKIFGADARLHAISGMPIEQGRGALHPDEQAIGHWGKLHFDLAALANRRRDAADKLASDRAALAGLHIAHGNLAPDDITGRQTAVYKLAAQDQAIANSERHVAALAAEHAALAGKLADLGAKLEDAGVFAKYGKGAAASWFSMINDKGWPKPGEVV